MQAEQQQPPIIYIHNGQQQPAKCHQCIQQKLGTHINLNWNITKGTMRLYHHQQKQSNNTKIQTQTQTKIQYNKQKQNEQQIQTIENAYFYHGSNCPFLRQDIILNPEKYMKPCACVMLFDPQTQQFLVTQRSPTLRTYPNAWVLPGGHLQKQQGIFEGGIRECQQQVGLPLDFRPSQPIEENIVMLWESVFAIDKQIKACSIVVFFVVYYIKEVSAYKWKSIHDNSDQIRYNSITKNGYAEGHLKYLQVVRKNMKFKNNK